MDTTTTEEYVQAVQKAAEYIRQNLGEPDIAITLGSGLSSFIDILEDAKVVTFKDIPHMPSPTVSGHADQVAVGRIAGRTVLVYAGRIHAYEGFQSAILAFSCRVACALGIRLYICTNSSGGAVPGMKPGCLTFLTDLINYSRRSFLLDTNSDPRLGELHPNLSSVFATQYLPLMQQIAAKLGTDLFSGHYAGTMGPAYETPSEVMAGVCSGAAVFGMSTVPEVTAVAAQNVPVVGISLVTNVAAGFQVGATLNHAEVKAAAAAAMPVFKQLLVDFISSVELPPRPSFSPVLHASAPSRPIPMPRAYPQVPTLAHAVAVAQALRAKLGSVVVPAAVFAPRSFARGIDSEWSINLRDVMGAAASSSEAFDGELRLVQSASTRVLLIVSSTIVGFDADEAALLVWALRLLNVCAVVVVARAQLANTGVPASKTFILSGITSPSSHMPVPAPRPLLASDMQPLLGGHHISLVGDGIGSYMGFPGGEPPTPAEMHWATVAKCSLVGVTNMAPLYAAHDVGMHTAAVAQIVSQLHNHSGDDAREVLQNAISKLAAAATAVLPPIPETDLPQPEPTLPAEIPPWPKQTSFEAVTAAVKAVTATAPQAKPRIGLVSELGLAGSVLAQLKVSHTIPCDSLPEAPKRGATLYLGTMHGTEVAYIDNVSHIRADAYTLGSATFGTRLLKLLGVQYIVALGTAVGCVEGLGNGEVIVLSDHVNTTGRNPLMGHNDDRWGERFPDMSAVYLPAARFAAIQAGAKEVVAFASLHTASGAERSAASEQKAQVLMSTCIADAVTASHMKIPMCTLAVAQDDMLSSPQSLSQLGLVLSAVMAALRSL